MVSAAQLSEYMSPICPLCTPLLFSLALTPRRRREIYGTNPWSSQFFWHSSASIVAAPSKLRSSVALFGNEEF